MAAFFQCTEIEKAEIHRFLHFEDEGRRNEHPRDVGLNSAHFGWPVRIRFRRFEEGDQPFLSGRTARIDLAFAARLMPFRLGPVAPYQISIERFQPIERLDVKR